MKAWERHVLAYIQNGHASEEGKTAVRILRKSYAKTFEEWFGTWIAWHQGTFRRFREVANKLPHQNRHRRRWLHARINAAFWQHGQLAYAMERLHNSVYYGRDVLPRSMAYLSGCC